MKTPEEILLSKGFKGMRQNRDFNLAVISIYEYAAQKEPKWISIEVRLPEAGKTVLVANNDFGIHMAYLNVKKVWKYHFNSEPYSMGKITHWMPLPPFKA